MRAWEFLGEHRSPPSPPVTLRALHKMKLEAQSKAREEQERFALMPLIYVNTDGRREQLELERMALGSRSPSVDPDPDDTYRPSVEVRLVPKSVAGGIRRSRHQGPPFPRPAWNRRDHAGRGWLFECRNRSHHRSLPDPR